MKATHSSALEWLIAWLMVLLQKDNITHAVTQSNKHTRTKSNHSKLLHYTRFGPFSRTTRVSQYQKSKSNLDFTEARDSEWQWHQLGHMQVCTSLQTDNHASIPPLSFFYRPDALPAAQPTPSKHWRQTQKQNRPSTNISDWLGETHEITYCLLRGVGQ